LTPKARTTKEIAIMLRPIDMADPEQRALATERSRAH
jgi:hypothetical protein